LLFGQKKFNGNEAADERSQGATDLKHYEPELIAAAILALNCHATDWEGGRMRIGRRMAGWPKLRLRA
jgi:hypothetical protein